jgi:hypothetical protein
MIEPGDQLVGDRIDAIERCEEQLCLGSEPVARPGLTMHAGMHGVSIARFGLAWRRATTHARVG